MYSPILAIFYATGKAYYDVVYFLPPLRFGVFYLFPSIPHQQSALPTIEHSLHATVYNLIERS